MRVAYLSNQFPSAVEPYVMDEIHKLRRCGVEVVPCSARSCNGQLDEPLRIFEGQTLYLQPVHFLPLLRAIILCIRQFGILSDIFKRILLRGPESPSRRARALLHTLLGAYYALLLEEHGVKHIHVHHGYFSSWIAMVAARLLGVSFSMTLHGSDLLVHPAYLDVKLKHCKFCLTVSEFNRRYIFENYPEIQRSKVIIQYMGVDVAVTTSASEVAPSKALVMLAVGRLHPIKNHSFLMHACHELKKRGLTFICSIAGEGPERTALKQTIVELKLEKEVRLLGHLSRECLGSLYDQSNLVVLTSHSEGVPLVLMEAMSHGRIVLAPAITGIHELVVDGKTGFLYRPGSMEHFLEQLLLIHAQPNLEYVSNAGRQHVLRHFNREKNLAVFSQVFIERTFAGAQHTNYANPLLQQVQLSIQRHRNLFI